MEEKKQFILNSFDNPPKVDETLVSCIESIANAYSRHKWNFKLPEGQVKIVLESLAMYRQLMDIGQDTKGG